MPRMRLTEVFRHLRRTEVVDAPQHHGSANARRHVDGFGRATARSVARLLRLGSPAQTALKAPSYKRSEPATMPSAPPPSTLPAALRPFDATAHVVFVGERHTDPAQAAVREALQTRALEGHAFVLTEGVEHDCTATNAAQAAQLLGLDTRNNRLVGAEPGFFAAIHEVKDFTDFARNMHNRQRGRLARDFVKRTILDLRYNDAHQTAWASLRRPLPAHLEALARLIESRGEPSLSDEQVMTGLPAIDSHAALGLYKTLLQTMVDGQRGDLSSEEVAVMHAYIDAPHVLACHQAFVQRIAQDARNRFVIAQIAATYDDAKAHNKHLFVPFGSAHIPYFVEALQKLRPDIPLAAVNIEGAVNTIERAPVAQQAALRHAMGRLEEAPMDTVYEAAGFV